MRGRPPKTLKSCHRTIGILKKRRQELGISREAIAKALGYDPYTVGRWERGEIAPSILKFIDWCDALHVSLTVVPDLNH